MNIWIESIQYLDCRKTRVGQTLTVLNLYPPRLESSNMSVSLINAVTSIRASQYQSLSVT
jgi:hypothetical protein